MSDRLVNWQRVEDRSVFVTCVLCLAMDPDQFKQLKVVNQLRRLNKAGEEMTWVNLLEYMGITEADYLEYGKIWRELGGEDPSASLRQKDQFIFLMDLKELCNRAKHIFRY